MNANLMEAARPSPSCGRAVMVNSVAARSTTSMQIKGELFLQIGSILESTSLSTSNLESSFMRAVVQRC